jgi:group I intron endonuclease
MIGIYKITSPTNKVYIGQSVDIKLRWSCHKTDNVRSKLKSSFKKHGFENHTFEILEECSIELLNERERFWQDFYDVLGPNGLNLRLTTISDKSGKFSEESRKRMSEAQKKYNSTLTEEERLLKNKKNSDAKKGKIKTKEHQDKLTLAIRNRTLSPEVKERIRQGSCKKVINTVTGETFDSIKEAAISIKMKTYNLENRLRNLVTNDTNLKLLQDV